MSKIKLAKTLAYLSGAPRVSLHPQAAASGPRAHILGVMRGFQENGWEVQSFIAGSHVPRGWVVGENSERALRANPMNRLAADFTRQALGWYNGWRVGRLLNGMDWCYERYGVFQALGSTFQRSGIPWIVETNGLFYVESSQDRKSVALKKFARWWERRVYAQCDVIVCLSHKLVNLIAEDLEIDRSKMIVAPVAADVERFDPDKVALPVRVFPQPTIGFVGTFCSWQALDLLIEAVADLRLEGVDFRLVLVGDGALRSTWQNLVAQLGMSESVHFTGRVPFDQVPSYIMGFDLAYSGQVALQAGSMYGSPSKIYEYMAMARPVIASDSFEDAGKLVRDGELGFLFSSGNKESLKQALRRAYQRREDWSEMGTAARQEILKSHSWKSRVAEMIAQIEDILRRKYGTAYPVGH